MFLYFAPPVIAGGRRMSVRREPSGRWRAAIKQGRRYVEGRTFDTRREALAWEQRQRAALAGGVDARASRQTVRALLGEWVEFRKGVVASKTATADAALVRLVPTSLAALSIGSVTDREVSRALVQLKRSGLAESSVKRFRASLSSFFAWCVAERLIGLNPVTGTRVPRSSEPPTQMHPLSEDELEQVAAAVGQHDRHLGTLVLIAGWTGLRWSELRAVRVRDFARAPMPLIVVQQAAPEGVATKTTKGRRTRRVPVADRVLSLVEACAAGKEYEALLFTTSGGARLHASAFKRTSKWAETGRGRRIHDLRHTAACLWLARGVDVVTVQAWMGHASVATTNVYLTHLGTGADRAGLDRLNLPGHARGTHRKEEGANA